MDPVINQDALKKQAAEAALDYVEGGVIGVGTGSTVNHFIDYLATVKGRIDGAVSSSEASTARMQQHGIPVLEDCAQCNGGSFRGRKVGSFGVAGMFSVAAENV